MGKRGPQKTPTAILKLRDSWRAKTRKGEPKAEASEPGLKCPNWVSKEAKKFWKEIVPHLEAVPGLVRRIDRLALGMLCDALAHYIKAKREIEKKGITIKGASGSQISNPANLVLQRAYTRFAKLVREFGMTPAARASIDIGEGEGRKRGGDDRKSRFFSSG